MIPKRIIVTEKATSLLSQIQSMCLNRMRHLHPSFELLFFSDRHCNEFVKSHYPGMLGLYQSLPLPVQRADVFRVMAALKLGGFYFDLDMDISHCVEDLCSHDLVLAEEYEMSVEEYTARHRSAPSSTSALTQIGNYAFAATAGNPFLEEVLREIVARTSVVDFFALRERDVYFSTGPDVFTHVFRNFPSTRFGNVLLLKGASDECARFKWAKPHWFKFGNYGTHLMIGSWKAVSARQSRLPSTVN